MLMILPPCPRAIMRLATACRVKNSPLTLTANTRSKLASVTSTMGAMSKIPALLTRMSIPPQRAATLSTAASIEAAFVTSSATGKARGGRLGGGEIDVRHGDLRPLGRVAVDDRRADAARAARHERDLVRELR